MTFDGRLPLMEDDLQLKTTFDGRLSSLVDDLQHKTTFGGRKQSFLTGGFLNGNLTQKTKSYNIWFV